MDRAIEQAARWLGGYRRMAVVILLLLIIATLLHSYRNQRAAAEGVSLILLGEQFAERVQRLHGLWLAQRHPASLHGEGLVWQFDPRGWPIGVGRLVSPSENCRQLWLALIGRQGGASLPLQFLASADGGGCEFGWQDNWLIYQFSDGRVRKKT